MVCGSDQSRSVSETGAKDYMGENERQLSDILPSAVREVNAVLQWLTLTSPLAVALLKVS